MKRTDALKIMFDEMNTHGLLDKGWSFGFDRATRRFGCCSYTKKRITISGPLTDVNPEHVMRETILHEIAHALAGWEAAHGPVWVRKARELGIAGHRCKQSAPDVQDVRHMSKWVGECPSCGYVIYVERLTEKTRYRKSCGRCSNTFDRSLLFRFRENTGRRGGGVRL